MRIGILSLPLHTNYGGILQAYALQTVLERMGHEVVVFDTPKEMHLPLWKAPLAYGKRFLEKYVMGNKGVCVFYEQKINRENPIIRQYTDAFISKYIHTKTIKNFSEFHGKYFDCIIVGSDQVWRPMYFTYLFSTDMDNAYLAFADKWNIKRVAYAPSFGTDEWEYTPKQTERCGELLRKFDGISVRESSGVGLCKEHFGVQAEHVLDPTMLLAKEDYIKLFTDAKAPKSKGTLLCYVLDETPEKQALVKRIANERNLVPFRVNNSKVENHSAPLNERIQPPVEKWLRGFYDAEFVVTDSFHACVFSILFEKQFVVVGNEKRGMSRFNSLLKMFGLENRLFINDDSLANLSDIDYSLVSRQFVVKKQTAVAFLNKTLNGDNSASKGKTYKTWA